MTGEGSQFTVKPNVLLSVGCSERTAPLILLVLKGGWGAPGVSGTAWSAAGG